MPRVLVTGGSGFIGQHLVSELVARGRQARILDVRPPTRTLSAAQYVEGSVLDTGLVNATVEGVRIARGAVALSSEKARRELGYVPRPVEPLLQEIIAHMVGASAGEVLKHA